MSGGRGASQGQAVAAGQQLSLFARFVIYGLVGWCIECLFTSVVDLASGAGDLRLRGYSYLWMHPIWGSGLLLGERLVGVLRRLGLNRVTRSFIGMGVCFAVEYSMGGVLVALIGRCPWDYSAAAMSVQGLIRLDYAPFWWLCAWAVEPLFLLVRRVRLGAGEPEGEVSPLPLSSPSHAPAPQLRAL
jgi:uncharacterized membrane protein